jgi:hypothetical protein
MLDRPVKLEVKVFLEKLESRVRKGPKETEAEEVLRVIVETWEHQDTKGIWERRESVE